MPATADEEIIAAQEQGVLSTLTDAARVKRISAELQMGFDALAHVGPAASFFGSARTAARPPRVRARARDRPHRRRGGPGDHHRRRPRRDGGRQPRRPRRGRALDRPQHRAALRAGPQRVLRHRPRVPLLLHAQDHVRALRERLRRLPRRLRHARRDVRGAHADPDRQDPPLPGRADRQRLLGRPGRLDPRAPAGGGKISAQDVDLLCVTDDPVEVRDRLMSAAHRQARTSVRSVS